MFSWFYIEGILILVGVNLMVVLGLSLLTGFTGLFSFGHAGFMAIGAYVSAICTLHYHMPFLVAMVLFSGVRRRVEQAIVPECFKGLPITLVAAAMTSLSFMGFGGIVSAIFGV